MASFQVTMGYISSTTRGVIVSSILPTGALAALLAGILADKYGRKRLIVSGAVIYGIGAAIECSSMALGMFLAGRLIKGVGQGLFLSTVYVQVSEISPASTRGTMTSVPQFLLVCGLVTGFFMSYGTASIKNSASWRLPIAIASILAFGFAALNLLTPPSPRWLLAKGYTEEARAVIAALGLDEAEQREMMANSASALEHAPDGSVWDSLQQTFQDFAAAFSAPFRARTAFGCFIMAFQQFCGIDGVLYYAPILFRQAGLSGDKANFLASGVSSLVILATVVPATIWADKWGRRTSSILGGTLITILMLVMGTMYAANLVHPNYGAGRWVVVVSIYLFAIVFNGTWAIAFRTFLVESLPRKTRSSASSLGQCSNWIANYIVALTTPVFIDRTTFGAYYFFACSAFICTVGCALYMFETKGHTLEVIEQRYMDSKANATGSRWNMEKFKLRPVARTREVQDISRPGSSPTSGDESFEVNNNRLMV
ncbi:general substrate transporter [Cryphonectria parasitica EP155]|uniref:General substrate transporter n=1 Tax=Cryphonectria parasitica (strain ATCC 38755 / EP155) TaxID=660469 RepID=A0A9P4YA50_CRYP1|nr:general substrate transporter [Cryphonectria parasitica EP155]KAF3769122.1 general substrate transporter [Cryphonectria parasitica EP155]